MVNILGSRVDNVDTQEALQRIEGFVREKRFAHIVTLNAEIAYLAAENAELRDIINQAALVTPDGSGILWAAEKLGCPLRERVTGIDLMNAACEMAADRGYTVFLLGSEDGVAAEAAEALCRRLPELKVCGTYHGFFLKEQNGRARVAGMLRERRPDLLFVAMGAPKQEYVIKEIEQLGVPMAVMGVGGSFDVISGHVKRAPAPIQKLRLEWLWRTLLQPSRWKRTMRLPLFMNAVKKQTRRK